MKLVLNDKEIVNFLISQLDYKSIVSDLQIENNHLAEVIAWWYEKKRSEGNRFNEKKHKGKLKEKIKKAVTIDLKDYVKMCEEKIKNYRKDRYQKVLSRINYFIYKLGEDQIFDAYRNSKAIDFVKGVGSAVTDQYSFIRRKNYLKFEEDCVIRNTVGNESCLLEKIKNMYPLWFIDSGYTNFLESNKKWHRIVRNHLHHSEYVEYPADRLSNFRSFPSPWRVGGEFILVIEPGAFSAKIFGTEIKSWKLFIENEIKKYSDKRIIFREKTPKKIRPKLFQELQNEDYYCVVNINSNAATEAIWAGVPIITLDKHISNSVGKGNLSDINNLYRGPLGNWLCMLSYNQFTYDELCSGFAVQTIKKYNEKI